MRDVIRLAVSALSIWVGCGLSIVGMRRLAGVRAALAVHALVAPALAAFVSSRYFSSKSRPCVTPVQAGALFAGSAVALDATIVAPLLEKSYRMFKSLLGTRMPLASIFAASHVAGEIVRRRKR